PARSGVFMPVGVDYKLFLNILAAGIFVALIAVTLRRGATDPVCGMTVDRAKALRLDGDGRPYYFCGPGCRGRFAMRAGGTEPPRGPGARGALTPAASTSSATPAWPKQRNHAVWRELRILFLEASVDVDVQQPLRAAGTGAGFMARSCRVFSSTRRGSRSRCSGSRSSPPARPPPPSSASSTR